MSSRQPIHINLAFTTYNDVHPILVDPTTRIVDLRVIAHNYLVTKERLVPIENLAFIYKGIICSLEATLQSLEVNDNDTIHVIQRTPDRSATETTEEASRRMRLEAVKKVDQEAKLARKIRNSRYQVLPLKEDKYNCFPKNHNFLPFGRKAINSNQSGQAYPLIYGIPNNAALVYQNNIMSFIYCFFGGIIGFMIPTLGILLLFAIDGRVSFHTGLLIGITAMMIWMFFSTLVTSISNLVV